MARRKDEASAAAEVGFEKLRGEITKIYAEAERDLSVKLQQFADRFRAQDEKRRADLAAGAITRQQYESWLRGQVFRGDRWKAVRQSCVDQIHRVNTTATDMMNGRRRAVFQQSVNYSAYQIERGTKGAVSFSLYDSATVTRLLKEDRKLLPAKEIGKLKDGQYNARGIQNAVTQGIIQGESIPDIAKRIAEATGSRNERLMTRYARTAMTSAQNAGRVQAMHDAEDMGIRVKKKWIATLDSRTRDAHAELDGQEVDVDEPFVVDGKEIMYPGDPFADAELVANCRCTLGWVYPDYPSTSGARRDNETGEVIGGITYREWESGKKEEATATVSLTSVSRQSFMGQVASARIHPNRADYRRIEDYDKALMEFDGKMSLSFEEVCTGGVENRFMNIVRASREYPESFGEAGRIDNALARVYEKVPPIDNTRFVLCDYDDAWMYLARGRDDRRLHLGTPSAQVFHESDGRIVIAFNRGEMRYTAEESMRYREECISNGTPLLAVFELDSPESIVMHEYGHVLDSYYTHALVHKDEDAVAFFEWYKSLSKEEISAGISSYATTNFAEFSAECFAEMQTSNPRPIARKYWEYMERLIAKRGMYTYDRD